MTQEHKKELTRVKRFIARAKKRGYQFNEDLISSLPELSTQKLKSLTTKKLYEQATSKKFGVELTGTRARQLERSLAAKKGAETRKRHYEQKKKQEQYSEEPTSFEDAVLRNIEELIAQYMFSSTLNYAGGAQMGDALLKQEIEKFGRAKVAQALEQSPIEAISAVQDAIYQESTEAGKKRACTRLQMIIEGTIPTIDEAKQMGNYEEMIDDNLIQNEDEDF